MKTLEELKNMIDGVVKSYKVNSKEELAHMFEDWNEEQINEYHEDQLKFYEEFKNYNFLSYSLNDGKARLHDSYESAKRCVGRGGQILVIDKEKVYNYKVKTEEEYISYITNEIRRKNQRKMDYYGL